jgi:gluconokinase
VSRGENIIALDIGTSSVRALLIDSEFNTYLDLGLQKKYDVITRTDGSVEIDPAVLLQLTCDCLDALHDGMTAKNLKAVGVGISTFWHCFTGIDRQGKPTTPVVHLFDTRSGQQMEQLTQTLNPVWIHAITGCMPHTSYWPAKLLWLKETHAAEFKATERWMSVGEYLLLQLTGSGAESISMVSASGIWDQRQNDYCDELLDVIGVGRDRFASVEKLDEPRRGLRPEFGARWPLFKDILWYPAYGDGACNSIGSGCSTPEKFALMVGTSGAMRVVVEQNSATVPAGIWCYRVNRKRFILGGAISNGGEVFRWASRTLRLPEDAESQIAQREPGSHFLTMLPYFAGERSPYWRPDLRAVIAGMSLATSPVDILQACLESVSLRFKQIYILLTKPFAQPKQIISSGGALLRSKAWQQMMADALGHSIVGCSVAEASSRGAAMIAAEQMGILADLDSVPLQLGDTVTPKEAHVAAYARMFDRDMHLFDALYGPLSVFEPPEQKASIGSTPAPFSNV